MSDTSAPVADDPVARALAIAQKLAQKHGQTASIGEPSVLGKRQRDEGERKQRKIYMPVDEHPDMNFFGLFIGPRGATQKSLESQSGARILLRGKGSGHEADTETEPLHVLIQADTEDQIDTAERLVNEILHDPEKMMSVKSAQLKEVAALTDGAATVNGGLNSVTPGQQSRELRIANDKVGLIIGRSGETIRSLEASTGAQIQISKEAGGPDRAVTLVGDEDSINRAVIEIDKICAGQSRPATSHAGETVKIPVPQNLVGVLIGRGGETVRAIQQRTGCLIQIQRANEVEPNSTTRDVSLTGSPQQVETARAEVMQIISAAQQGGTNGEQTTYITAGAGSRMTVNIDVPSTVVGTIIGRGGETIKRLQQLTGARIQLDKADPSRPQPQRTVTIQGDAQAVERARHEVEELIREKQATGGAMITPNYARGAPQQPYGAAAPYGAAPSYGYPPQHAPPHAMPYGQYPPHDPYYAPHAAAHNPYGASYPPHAAPAQHAAPYGQQDYYRRDRDNNRQGGQHQANQSAQHDRATASPEPGSAPAPQSNDQSVDLPTPPTDEAEFAVYWTRLNPQQQQEYYRRYYPELLNKAQGEQ